MIEIQVLSPDDWPLWRELRLAALAEAPGVFGSTLADWSGAGDRADRWRARLELAASYNLIAHLDGVPVGMASGVPGEQPGHTELISMWVAPAGRGRGVAAALIGAVAAWSRTQGVPELRLMVVVDNAAAIGLYRRCGFAGTGHEQPMPDGVRRELEMSLKL
ncbi:GNAT family N-acetyltransferase [Catellatospora sp. KI3]|uniref:GNAT family N-acetyltransferase n=1 Tax=Catellatospora sp. KI3 TaxID=3041620 RepID=UPI0024832055|nr:GNAT family N-acetyltransferase [Catellatospora sp. KI3]MDI1462925.1 GNAT family N-acetyltransferase [Catellatospora sp. KI3]